MFARTLISTTGRRVAVAQASRNSVRSAPALHRAFTAATVAGRRSYASAAPSTQGISEKLSAQDQLPAMQCFQCEQTRDGVGCTVSQGVCGKTPEVATLQDLLVQVVANMSAAAAKDEKVAAFCLNALFATLTNVNFSESRFVELIEEAARIDPAAAAAAGITAETLKSTDALIELGRPLGVAALQKQVGDDVAGLREMVMYGIKGTAAYLHHALEVGAGGSAATEQLTSLMNELAAIADPNKLDLQELVAQALRVGGINLAVMALLEGAHTGRYGAMVPTQVVTSPIEGKCILVSGHDMADLEGILKATEGKNINVFTHGEMLPAHAYPGLKKYSHLAGHYGGNWSLQKMEFSGFPGPIVMTSNCLVANPLRSYKQRLFTRQIVGHDGVAHLEGDAQNAGTWEAVVAAAEAEQGFNRTVEPATVLTTGVGKDYVLENAGVVIDAIKAGDLKQFYVLAGCDGAEPERDYWTHLAERTPDDSAILTLGCAKFRFNRLLEGQTVAGLPKVLDIGQCNDAHGALQIALALSSALETPVNDLPISYAISWLEQKAVAVLLTMLHLNIQGIKLGPAPPAFVTPAVLNVLVENFNLGIVSTPDEDFGHTGLKQKQ